jgi:ABC-type dipeptide/oligopeptide/nickel transport system permease component
MFGIQPLTPVIVKVVSDPTPQVTVVDVLVDALGLTGLIVAGSFVLGGVVGVLLIAYSRWKAERSDRAGATDHTSLDLSSPAK